MEVLSAVILCPLDFNCHNIIISLVAILKYDPTTENCFLFPISLYQSLGLKSHYYGYRILCTLSGVKAVS